MNGGNLTLAGDNTAATAGLKLATAGSPGSIFFATTSSLGGSNQTVTVPAGIAFGGAAVNSGNYANSARFATTSDSIYNVSNLDGTPDLSPSGLNQDVWIGLSGASINSYTPPTSGADANKYRIVPVSNTTEIATAFTGGNDLIVSAGALPTDSQSSPTSLFGATLSINVPQDFTGATKITGVVRNTIMGGTTVGANLQGTTVTLTNNGTTSQGDFSATNGVTVDLGAALNLAGGPTNNGGISSGGININVKGARR